MRPTTQTAGSRTTLASSDGGVRTSERDGTGGGSGTAVRASPYSASSAEPSPKAARHDRPETVTAAMRAGPTRSPTVPSRFERARYRRRSSPARSTSATSAASTMAVDAAPMTKAATARRANDWPAPKAASEAA